MKKALWVSAAICLLSLVGMVLSLALTGGRGETGEFVPPPFEEAAESGTPTVADESYTRIFRDGMSFSAHVTGRVILTDGAADLWFTSDRENEVWLKLRILDEKGNILAETGLLKPGEYVKSVRFSTLPKDGERIRLKIMAYEKETYESVGAVTLNTTATVRDS